MQDPPSVVDGALDYRHFMDTTMYVVRCPSLPLVCIVQDMPMKAKISFIVLKLSQSLSAIPLSTFGHRDEYVNMTMKFFHCS